MENDILLTSDRYPFLEVAFRIKNYEHKTWALVDSGFDGYLIVPNSLLNSLGDADYIGRWELGDASTVESTEYLGEVNVLGIERKIPSRITCLGSEYLLGRKIIDQFRITFDRGQRLLVEL